MSNRSRHPLSSTVSRRAVLAGAALALTTAGAGRTAAQTPEAAAELDFADRIGALLAAMPARETAAGAPVGFFYADLAGQLASVGVDRPAADEPMAAPAGFFEATLALPLAARAFEVALDPRWFETFGFNPYAAGQALFEPAVAVSVFRGGFDRATVERALAASGYVQVRREHGDALTVGDEIAPETPVGRLGLGTMNHATVGDDLLVFARQERDLEAILAVLAGAAPSLAEQETWTATIPLFSADIVGLIPVAPGASTPGGVPASPAATPVTPASPLESPLESLALGVRSGSRAAPLALGPEGTPAATPVGAAAVPARVEARLRYAEADIAAREAEAIPERWREATSAVTGGPFTELMGIEAAGVSPVDRRAVAIDFVADTPNRWSQLVLLGDLAPLMPPVG